MIFRHGPQLLAKLGRLLKTVVWILRQHFERNVLEHVGDRERIFLWRDRLLVADLVNQFRQRLAFKGRAAHNKRVHRGAQAINVRAMVDNCLVARSFWGHV